MMIAVV